MAERVVLLTDDWAFDRLRRQGRLPSLLLRDDAADVAQLALGDDDAAHPQQIRRLRPGQVLPPDDPTREQSEQSDYLLAVLLGATVCHVVVAGEHADAGEWSPQQIVDWYARFHRATADRIAEHRRQYRHVLVLILADPPGPDAAARLRALLRPGGMPFDAVYVMGADLELGQNRYFHARHVWPVATAGLLLRLTAGGLDVAAQRKLCGWRGLLIQPTDGDRPADAAFADLQRDMLARLHRRLAGATADEQADPPPRLAAAGVDIGGAALQAPGRAPERHWQEFDAAAETERVIRPERWEKQFVEQGVRVVVARTARALNTLASLRDAIAARWQRVHRVPAEIYRRAARDADALPDFAARQQDVAEAAERLRRLETRRAAAAAALRADAAVLDEARAFFTDLGVRLAAATFVALAVFWAGHLLHFYLGLTRAWLYLSAAALAGAVVPVATLWLLERYRGERAMDALLAAHGAYDTLTTDRYRTAWDLFDTAGRFNAQRRVASAARRMRLLLARAAALVDAGLQPTPAARGVAGEDAVAVAATAGVADRFANEAHEIAEFDALTRSAPKVPPLDASDTTQLDALIEHHFTQFRDRCWTPLCDRHDPGRRGLLPVRATLGALSRFLIDFHIDVERFLTRALVGGAGAGPMDDCAEAAIAFTSKPFWLGMSLTAGTREPIEVRRLVLLNPDYRSALESRLADKAAMPLADCPALEGRCTLALVFEEFDAELDAVLGPASAEPADEEPAAAAPAAPARPRSRKPRGGGPRDPG